MCCRTAVSWSVFRKRRSVASMAVVMARSVTRRSMICYGTNGWAARRSQWSEPVMSAPLSPSDTARFRTFIALELNVSVHDVQAFVLGGHGDTMVPLARMCTVAGVPITKLIKPDRIEAIVKRTRDGGAEIVNLLKSGSAYYAPSAAVAEMVDAIMLDRKQILPCAVRLEGEYGIRGLFVGVPVKLGAGGAEEIIELDLTDEERTSLRRSADSVKELVGVMGI